MEQRVLSVANVNAYIKQMMDKDFILKNLWVQGEVSNYKAHQSGHLYFTLKDGTSAISCVMFRSYVQNLDRPLANGMKLMVGGSVSVYERSGQYQIYVRQVREDGVGQLYQAYEALKKKLESEGLFDDFAKQSIPAYPKSIGVVTSATGAAIRDITRVTGRRNPYVQLKLYPSLVQGPQAAENIVRGIQYFNRHADVDVVLIGRGGGSIEDLWPFNEEIVARAIAASNLPIISAVGHETDFTISDFVSDLRAATPSAGAELAVYDYRETMERLEQYRLRLDQWMKGQLTLSKSKLNQVQIRLEHQHPRERFEKKYQYIAELEDRLGLYMQRGLDKRKHRVALLQSRLEGHSPMKRLKGGYGYISDLDHKKIDTVTALEEGKDFLMTLSDGEVTARAIEIRKENRDHE